MSKGNKIGRFLFIAFFLTSVACSGGGSPPQPQPPPPPALLPVPFFDSILAPEERQGLSEKYRALFINEKVLKAIQNDQFVSFPEWEAGEQKKLLETLLFYEKNNGEKRPPFEGNCSPEGAEPPCFTLFQFRVSQTRIHPVFANYLKRIHIAWNLYVEANHLVPWSILNYSEENLKILFYSVVTQPRLGRHFFGVNFDPSENYQIVRGLLREEKDHAEDLVGEDSLRTLLGILQFVGKRVTHFTGANNDIGPESPSWPYPVRRMPSPKEVLIDRNPHRNLRQNPNALFGPKYHIVLGCWGGSQLLKSLLGSINLPVELLGDYVNFGGHSGARFLEIGGNDYYLDHADDLYHFSWMNGLLKKQTARPNLESWGVENFFPFKNIIPGYSVLHADKIRSMAHAELLQSLGIEADKVALFEQELGPNFGPNTFDLDFRVLAVRAISAPSTLSLFARCAEPDLNRRHLPIAYLTDFEELLFSSIIDQEILRRRLEAGNNDVSCFDLLFEELNDLYKNKTGLELRGDEDGDGFENFRDCNIYKIDIAPCDKAFYTPLGIIMVG